MFKRIINLGYNSWKKRREQGTFLSFYMKNPGDDRNILARCLDFAGILVVAFLTSFTLLSNYTKNQKAFLFSIAFLVLTAVIVDIITRRRLAAKLLQNRRESAVQKFLHETEEISDKEYFDRARELLEKHGVKFLKTNLTSLPPGCTAEAEFNNRPVLIYFAKSDGGSSVSPEKGFVDNLVSGNYEAGILVTRDENAREKFKDEMYIEVIDQNSLACLFARIQYPSPAGTVKDSDGARRDKIKTPPAKVIFSPGKIKGYIISGLLLLGMFMLDKEFSIVNVFYLFFGTLNIALGSLSYIMEKQRARIQLLKS